MTVTLHTSKHARVVLRSIAGVFDLSGKTTDRFYRSAVTGRYVAPKTGISRDWKNVGNDLRKAISQAEAKQLLK